MDLVYSFHRERVQLPGIPLTSLLKEVDVEGQLCNPWDPFYTAHVTPALRKVFE